jgi:voltage-gated sodium channel
MYTLFQIMTLESWSMGIVRPVMEAFPYAWAFFIPFILLATFVSFRQPCVTRYGFLE